VDKPLSIKNRIGANKMNQVVIRQIITFSAIIDSQIIDLKFQTNLPADMSIPLPGDEVRLPDEVGKNAGFDNGIFKVITRRFSYNDIPVGVGGVVSLLLTKSS